MCTGLELAGIAASTGGAVLNNNIQNRAIAETNNQNRIRMDMEKKARTEETARQAAMEATSAAEVAQALTQVDPATQAATVEAEAAAPENQITQSAEVHNTPTIQGQVQNSDVSSMIGDKVAERLGRTREMLKNMAILSGQDSASSAAGDALGRSSSEIQTTNSNRRGSMNASQLETSIPAAEVTKSKSLIGDLLMLAGSGAASMGGRAAGMSGGRLFGGANAANRVVPNIGDVMAGGLY